MKKSNLFKRVLALSLLLVMAFGILGVQAYAEGVDLGAETKGSVTVSGAEAGVTVSAYQLMTVTVGAVTGGYQPKEPAYVWVDAVADWVRTNYPAYIGEDDNRVTAAFSPDADPSVSDSGTGAANAALFYDKLANAIKSGTVSLSATKSETTDENGAATIADLPLGNYLILTEGGMRVYKPLAVNLIPAYDETKGWQLDTPVTANVVAKSSLPSVDKKVGTAANSVDKDAVEVNIGDTVYYEVVVDIPRFPENAIARNFVISDKMDAGLTFNTDSLKVYGVKADGTETELAENTNFTRATKNPKNDSAVDFAVIFSDKAKYDTITGYEKIKLTYSAILNKDAVIGAGGNWNTVTLDYSNNPYVSGNYNPNPPTDKTVVYSYGLDITKVDAQNTDTKLPGAEFTLKLKGESTAIKFVGEAGSYRKALTDNESGATTTLVTGTNGKLTLTGLAAGTYVLEETKAPGGYNLPQTTTIEIVIKDELILNDNGSTVAGLDGKVETSGENDTVEHHADGLVPLTVTNSKLFTLPQTGGTGTLLFSLIGVVLMGAGVLVVLMALRRRKVQ